MPLLGRFTIPFHSVRITLRNTIALFITHTQIELRLRMSLLG